MTPRFLLNAAMALRNSLRPLLAVDELDERAGSDPDGLLLDGETKLEREQRLALEQRQTRERAEKKDQHEKDERDFLVTVLILQEQQRLANGILADIADARKAIALAYGRAHEEQTATIERFDLAQRNAVVLTDGQRVYFTHDGAALYGEDFWPITDRSTIAEARQRQTAESTYYENYHDRWMERSEAKTRVERLQNTLSVLDDIQQRVESGKLNADELVKAREDADSIFDALPSEIRVEYGRIRAARSTGESPAYRAADGSFSSLPTVSADFFKAVNSSPEETKAVKPDNSATRTPAYRSVPEF